MVSREPDDAGSDDPRDAFDQIVAGLELSMPDDLDLIGPDPEPARDVFDPRLSDPLDEPEVDDESDHFVPPEPDPLPQLDPLTRLAWGILVGSPFALLFMIVFALGWPQWLASGLVLLFVAALVFLLFRRGNHDRGSDPDQGAVI